MAAGQIKQDQNTQKVKKDTDLIRQFTERYQFSMQTPFSSDNPADNTLTNNEMKKGNNFACSYWRH